MAAGDLATLDDVRRQLQVQTSDTGQDELISGLITRYSTAISRYCARQFAPPETGATHRFRLRPDDTLDGLYALEFAPYDLRAATSVQLHPETAAPVTLTQDVDYTLEPSNPVDGVYASLAIWPVRVTWTSTAAINFGYINLDVTGDWGFDEIPGDVTQACVNLVLSALRADITSFGSVLQPNSVGQGANDAVAMPPGVRGLLARYMRAPVF